MVIADLETEKNIQDIAQVNSGPLSPPNGIRRFLQRFDKWIIVNNQPFSVVENTAFKKMASKAFPGQVSFTLDAWTSKNQIPFQELPHIGLPSIRP
nr:1003_t:CDS:2 [Entrophospora candida]